MTAYDTFADASNTDALKVVLQGQQTSVARDRGESNAALV
jgi:hypothetical protein